MKRASPLAAALIALLVALAVRGAVLLQGPDLPPDGVFDLEIARDLQHGDWRSAVLRRFHPLEGALAAGVASIRGVEADEASGLVVSVLAGSLAAFFAALAASEALRERAPRERTFAGLAAGLLVAAHPDLAHTATTVWSYPLSHLCLSAGLLLGTRALARASRAAALGVGVVTALAYLARPDGVVILAGFLAGLALAARERARFLLPLAALVGFTLVASPYVVALHAATGEWRITLKKDERHLVGMRDLQAPPPQAPPASDFGAILSRAEAKPDPGEMGLVASARYVVRRSATTIHPLLLLLGAAGLLVAHARSRRLPALLVLGAFVAAHTLLKANERDFNGNHPSAEAVIFAIWSGIALAPLASSRRARAVALGAVVAILLAKTREAHQQPRAALTRVVAAALRDRKEPGRELVVCGRDARPLTFLAGARLVELPRGDVATVTSVARGAGARWLAVFVRTHGAAPTAVLETLDDAGLELAYREQRSRPAEKGSILYTWLLYDLEAKR